MLRILYRALLRAAPLIALAPTSSAQISAIPPMVERQPEIPTVTEHLKGVVLNSATGEPVPGVLVTAPGRQLAVLTDYRGQFQFDLLRAANSPAGNLEQQTLPISFQLRKPGYLGHASLASVPYYASTQIPGSIELRITPAAVITGHVDTDSGTPESRHLVSLYVKQVSDGLASWVQMSAAQPNSRGDFRFPDLPAGNFKIAVIRFDPARPNRQSDADSIQGSAATFYPNADSLEAAEILHASAGQTVTANLTARSATLYRAVVPVVLPDTLSGPNTAVNTAILPHTLGLDLGYDAERHAVIGYLPPGAYDLRLSTTGTGLASASVHLQVGSGPVRSAPLTLHPAVEVPIFVRWEGSSGDSSDAREKNYFFTMPPLDEGSYGQFDGQSGRERARSDSAMHVALLTEGVFGFEVNAPGGYMASALCGTTDLLRESLHVGPGESPQPIQVTLRQDGASLRVTIADPSYAPVASTGTLASERIYMALAIPLDQPRRQALAQFLTLSTAATAGTNFMNLAPGRYLVVASQQDEMRPSNPEFRNPDVLADLLQKGTVVTLAAGEKRSVQVPLLPRTDQ